MAEASGTVSFQVCGSCRRTWSSWDAFVRDPAVRLLGLQALVTKPEFNLLVFEHRCGSSISILARRLRQLLPEPEPQPPATLMFGTEPCPGHCRRLSDLEACDNPCANARDRQLILLVLRIKRESEAASTAHP
ncbi:MAG: hypothetical protein IH602_21100 [Bryobacteraceae bacterium]|nr:hypothetical protein [Bryobacteraceae bacterium]